MDEKLLIFHQFGTYVATFPNKNRVFDGYLPIPANWRSLGESRVVDEYKEHQENFPIISIAMVDQYGL